MGGGGGRWLRGEVKVRNQLGKWGERPKTAGQSGGLGRLERTGAPRKGLERPPSSAQSLANEQRPMVDPLKMEGEQGVEGQGGQWIDGFKKRTVVISRLDWEDLGP